MFGGLKLGSVADAMIEAKTKSEKCQQVIENKTHTK
jgi:hypothetical protein